MDANGLTAATGPPANKKEGMPKDLYNLEAVYPLHSLRLPNGCLRPLVAVPLVCNSGFPHGGLCLS